MANTLIFQRSNQFSQLMVGSRIKLSPVSNPSVSGSYIGGAEPAFELCDSTGTATFTGSFANTYKVEFQQVPGTKPVKKETIFFITVPAGNGTLNAKDYIIDQYTNTNTSSFAYTKTASDSLFIHKDNLVPYFTGSGVTITPVTQGPIQTLTITANAGGLTTGSTYPITSSYAITASYALNGTSGGSGATLPGTGSTVPWTASWASNITSSGVSGTVANATAAGTARTASYLGGVDAIFTNPGDVIFRNGKYVRFESHADGFRETGLQFTGSNGDGTWMMDTNGLTTFDGVLISTQITPSGDARFVGDITASRISAANGFTGSIQGTSSVALTSLSASFVTASNVFGTVGNATNAGTALTASFITSSNLFGTVANATNAGTARTASFVTSSNVIGTVGNAGFAGQAIQATSSLSASYITSSNVFGTVTNATNAGTSLTASFVTSSNVFGTVGNSTNAGTALTASFVTSSNVIGTVANALNAGFAAQAVQATSSLSSSFIGTGTSGYFPRWNVGNILSPTSSIFQNGTQVGVGTTTPAAVLDVSGSANSVILGISTPDGQSIITLGSNDIGGVGPYISLADRSQVNRITISGEGDTTISPKGSVILGPLVGIQLSSPTTASAPISGSTYIGNHSGSHFGTSSWAINVVNGSVGGGTTLFTGSTYPITASWANNALTASYVTSSNVFGTVANATNAGTATTSSYALTASLIDLDQFYIFQTTGSQTGSNGQFTCSFSQSVVWMPINVNNRNYNVTFSNMPTVNNTYRNTQLIIDQTSATNSGSSFTWPSSTNISWIGTGNQSVGPSFFTGSTRAIINFQCFNSASVQKILGTIGI